MIIPSNKLDDEKSSVSVASASSISWGYVNIEIEFYSFQREQVKLFSLNTSTDKPP